MSTVDSPIYGVQHPIDFYQALSKDTQASKLKINGIFEDSDTSQLALYFNYQWTLNNGQQVIFDVVDIIRFNDRQEIVELKIIYDTVQARKLVESLKK